MTPHKKSFEGITKDSNVVVIHYREDAAKWEILESTPGDGTVTAVFANGFSPVAILVKNVATAALGNSQLIASNDQLIAPSDSPKTGESPILYVMSGIALLAAIGVVVSRIRTEE